VEEEGVREKEEEEEEEEEEKKEKVEDKEEGKELEGEDDGRLNGDWLGLPTFKEGDGGERNIDNKPVLLREDFSLRKPSSATKSNSCSSSSSSFDSILETNNSFKAFIIGVNFGFFESK
jgi:hypothetical protein